jgi:uncharacterized protein YbjT (DUF2867 family)
MRMYLVMGATGQTGAATVSALLAKGKPVRALVRSEAKAADLRARGVGVALGDLSEPTSVVRALAGVKAAYCLLPPDPTTTDLTGRNRTLADNLASALRDSQVEHVVLLSSIAAHLPGGTGPIATLHHAEAALKATGKTVTCLRAAYFMENTAGLLGLMKAQGIVPCFFHPARKIPMIATQDIGACAADLLMGTPLRGGEIVDLDGPGPVSYEDVAAAYGRALGKAVSAVPVPPEGIVPALMQAGFSANVAGHYAEMAGAADRGVLAFSGGTRHVRGRTSIDDVARTVVARA